MPRPGPARRAVPLRLSDEEERPVRELAAQLPPLPRGKPNLSAALRQIIAEWAAGQGRRTDLTPATASAAPSSATSAHTATSAAATSAAPQRTDLMTRATPDVPLSVHTPNPEEGT